MTEKDLIIIPQS